jgi:hypothetical protein
MTATELIKQAAAIVGNETKLADACEVTRQSDRAKAIYQKSLRTRFWVGR